MIVKYKMIIVKNPNKLLRIRNRQIVYEFLRKIQIIDDENSIEIAVITKIIEGIGAIEAENKKFPYMFIL